MSQRCRSAHVCEAGIAVPSEEPEELPPVVADRQQSLRRELSLAGLIVSRDGSHHWDCTVGDLTDGGARIRIAGGEVIPVHGYLIIPGKEITHEAEVVLKRRGVYGLKFLRTLQRTDLDAAELQFLSRLLVERLPRTSST
jgi:hypothetical protein